MGSPPPPNVPRVFLWSAPRCISTAFEHSVRTLAGVTAFHEPFSAAVYLGEERTFPRYADVAPIEGFRFSQVKHRLQDEASQGRGVFVKDMAYAILDHLEYLPPGFTHSFLIRDPRRTLPSLHRVEASGRVPAWSEFIPEEAGFRQMWRLYQHLEASHRAPTVVDASDLLNDPGGIMRAYCTAVGLPYADAMVRWERGRVAEDWGDWEGEWYHTLISSEGFEPPGNAAPPDPSCLPEVVQIAIRESIPYYERLYECRLPPP